MRGRGLKRLKQTNEGMVMEPAVGGEVVAAQALAAMQKVEAEAEEIVAQARTEAKELLDRARREAEERRTTAHTLTVREAQLRIQELLAKTRQETDALSARAKEELANQQAELGKKMPHLVDEIVARILAS